MSSALTEGPSRRASPLVAGPFNATAMGPMPGPHNHTEGAMGPRPGPHNHTLVAGGPSPAPAAAAPVARRAAAVAPRGGRGGH